MTAPLTPEQVAAVDEALVDKAAQRTEDHAYRHLVSNSPNGHVCPSECLARAVLAAVLPDIRRQLAEEIAAALEAERPEIAGPNAHASLRAPGALEAFGRARTLNEAAFIARYIGGAPLGRRYDEPGAVDDMRKALRRARERHAESARTSREASSHGGASRWWRLLPLTRRRP